MAIVKFSTPITGLRGTIGGLIFSANKSGPHVKPWTRSANPRTSPQTIQRAHLATMPGLWTALTGVQQTAWDTFAALAAQDLENPLGETYSASGYNWFCKCNIRLIRMGITPITTTPTQARPAAPSVTDFRVCKAGSESDLATGGTPSAFSEDPANPASKAFDGLIGATDRYISAFGDTTGWIQYVMTAAKNIKKYMVYIFDDTDARRIKSWTFDVFEGGGWTPLHTITNFAPTAPGWYTFYCPNTFTETTYRLDLTANNGNPNVWQLYELDFFEGDLESSVIIYDEDEYADSPDYDLVLRISLGRNTGMQVQYPGFYEIVLNDYPGRWYQEFQNELTAIFGTIETNRSWFSRLYRQTTEGIRSAAQANRTETIS